jgi:hypothetical protein
MPANPNLKIRLLVQTAITNNENLVLKGGVFIIPPQISLWARFSIKIGDTESDKGGNPT